MPPDSVLLDSLGPALRRAETLVRNADPEGARRASDANALARLLIDQGASLDTERIEQLERLYQALLERAPHSDMLAPAIALGETIARAHEALAVGTGRPR